MVVEEEKSVAAEVLDFEVEIISSDDESESDDEDYDEDEVHNLIYEIDLHSFFEVLKVVIFFLGRLI
jgi:hypothetical protein